MPKSQKLIKLKHSVYSLHYHLILVAKYRHKAINQNILNIIDKHSRGVTKAWGGTLLEFNGEKDHGHILLSLPPTLNLTKFVNNIKSITSRVVRKTFPDHVSQYYWEPVFWSRSYCLVSCGGAPLSVIKQYIENQEDIV